MPTATVTAYTYLDHHCMQVAPITIHPAFEKAASYFDVKIIHVPLNDTDYTVNMEAYRQVCDSTSIYFLDTFLGQWSVVIGF